MERLALTVFHDTFSLFFPQKYSLLTPFLKMFFSSFLVVDLHFQNLPQFSAEVCVYLANNKHSCCESNFFLSDMIKTRLKEHLSSQGNSLPHLHPYAIYLTKVE